MKRKDTILIGVIVNAALLGVLFTTAVIYDPDQILDKSVGTTSIVDVTPLKPREKLYESPSMIALNVAGDEVDQAINSEINSPSEDIFVNDVSNEDDFDVEKEVVGPSESPKNEGFIEVKVKKGDSLDKIAKANKTTVKAIREANQLKNDKLQIGQTLKIPTKKETSSETSKATEKKSDSSSEYYTVKSGDNPWKIAKQFNITSDDILSLNNMDEAKARNLKAGDRIRVK